MVSSQTQALLGKPGALQIKDHRKRLNRRIRELKGEIQALQECYNSLALPNRIPPEILSNIFLAVALHSKVGDDDEEDLEWIRVTHVCRYWRQTGLDYLELWTNLSFVNPEFTKVMITRSRNAPLFIECGWRDRPNIDDILRKVLSRTKRLRSVSLAHSFLDSDPLDFPSLLSLMSGLAPALEEIQLCMIQNGTVVLPTQFLEGTAPNLKVLHLLNVSASNWSDLPIRATLTRLRLERRTDIFHFSPAPNPASPTWTQLLAALQDMASLDELVLTGFLPTGSMPIQESPTMPTGPITLHKLRRLNLLDLGAAVEKFLAVVRFPKAAEVDFGFGDVKDLLFLRRFLSKLGDSWDGRCQTPARHMRIFDTKVVNGPRVIIGFDLKNPITGKPKLELNFTKAEHPTLCDIMIALQERVDFSQLSMLQVMSDTELTKEAWSQVFGSLRELRTISFKSNSFSEAFADALGALVASGAAFPALASLDFMFQDFGTRLTSQLISALQSRPASSPKLQVNFFAECRFKKDSFRRIVDSLPSVRVRRHGLDDEESDFVCANGMLSDDDVLSSGEGSEDGDDLTDSSNGGSTGSSNGEEEEGEDEDSQGEEDSSGSEEDSDGNEGPGVGSSDEAAEDD